MTEGVSLREYVDTNFELRDRALRIQFSATEQALLLATNQLESRLLLLNELRGNVATKGEVEAEFKAVRAELASLSLSRAEGAGRKIGMTTAQGVMVLALTILFGLIGATGTIVAMMKVLK